MEDGGKAENRDSKASGVKRTDEDDVGQDQLYKESSAQAMKTFMRISEVVMLLQQFSQESVKKDFLAGKIMKGEDVEAVWHSLVALHKLFSPEWTCDPRERIVKLEEMGKHAWLLISESNDTFVIPSNYADLGTFSYASWMEALMKLRDAPYWRRCHSVAPTTSQKSDSISLEVVDTTSNEDDSVSKLKRRNKKKKSAARPRPGTNFFGSASKRESQVKPSARKGGIDYIEITDSSDDVSSNEGSTDSEEEFLPSRVHKYFPRDVVPPEVFDVDSKSSLKSFFDDFQEYFGNKFYGNKRASCRELGRFLKGDCKDAYDSLGGSQLKYPVMKAKLLEWYKSQQVGRGYKRRSELKHATLREGETFKLYCMRLQELASRAYPNDDYEVAKQLKKRLLATVPKWFVRCIEKKEEMKSMLGKGKKINWADIIEVAEAQDKKIKKKKLVDSDVEEVVTQMSSVKVSSVEQCHAPQMSKNSQSPPPQAQRQRCNYCGWPGHVETQCKRKAGLCFACGGKGHNAYNCPTMETFKPMCSSCQGAHLGMECPKKQSTGGRQNRSPPGQRSSAVNSGAMPKRVIPVVQEKLPQTEPKSWHKTEHRKPPIDDWRLSGEASNMYSGN